MSVANDPKLTSWVAVGPMSDFPIQNLPFGIFSQGDGLRRAGVAIGEQILDLAALQEDGYLDGMGLPDGLFAQPTLNAFIGRGRAEGRRVRERVSILLRHDNHEIQGRADRDRFFVPMAGAQLHMPVFVRDYTDFYSSEQHAYNVGCMFRDPEHALLPNWKHLPVGYHGRASSIVVSGTPLHRPKGQTRADDAEMPSFGPTRLLDFELEMAFVTCRENGLGNAVRTQEAEDYVFGLVLFNDWSARDMQKWEYVPLGPFLAKNFGSSISPWIVTLDALEPFRVAGTKQDPAVLPYLESEGDRNFDIRLEVAIQPENSVETIVSRSNFRYMYWNISQQLAHHTVNGCNVGVGDLYASGTISGPSPDSYGSMLELSWRGTRPVVLSDGSERRFILDGDTVIMRGYAEKDGVRVGFGEVTTKILPAKP
ncbi:MAG: fumarylacetoacetase [Cyclobacteriaceae bacterium]|nr:fumarylacetoacetase [Cyclobacteriaceae bacterium]